MKRLTIPLAITLVLAAVYLALRVVATDVFEAPTFTYMKAVLFAAVSVSIVRVVDRVLFDIIFVKRNGREAPALLRGLLATILYAIAFLAIYKWVIHASAGFEILATSTVLSVILGLALQDTLGNFFAGLSLHVEQPFRILDAIRIGDMVGKVESVTWRTTTIRTNNNSLVVYPNSRVAREPIEIYTYNNLNRRVLSFPAPYSVLPDTIKSLICASVASLPQVAPEKPPVIRLNSFSDSSVTYEVLYWVKDYTLAPDIDSKIRERIWYVYRRHGIDIPFPIRHLLVDRPERPAKGLDEEHRKLIESVDLFEPLSVEEKNSIAESAVHHAYAPGELILRCGEKGDSMFIVHRGSVEVRLPSANGDGQPVATLEPGSFFGEMGLLTGEPRTADVSALGHVEVLEIRKAAMQQILTCNAQLAAALSEKMANRQAELSQLSLTAADEQKRMRKQSILARVQHFFGLSLH
jgi:small-conductance mechanosensitive channel/CRP-like cAMP-binding protein